MTTETFAPEMHSLLIEALRAIKKQRLTRRFTTQPEDLRQLEWRISELLGAGC